MRRNGREIAKDELDSLGNADGGQDTECRADQPGRQRVAGAFGNELLDELSALRSDRPFDAHLGAPLGGEHGEDQDDQQHARHDREHTEEHKDRGEGRTGAIRRVDPIFLDGGNTEPMTGYRLA